ncbi:MAG: hypothetical protein LIR25_06760 [bacterium]|nr:hypothetical protein [bacterium]
MPSRYYFLSSLPMLRFQDHAPVTWERFLDEAHGNVSEADYRILCGIADGSDGGHGFLRSWNQMNRRLDDAVNAQRRSNLGLDDVSGVVFRELDIEKVSNAACGAKNPLEAEMILMKFRYDWLEREKGLEPFSEKALLSYALQLRILLRKDLFTVESGNSEYNRLFDIIQKQINTD